MARHAARLLSIAWIALAAGGCASAPARFYVLQPTSRAAPDQAPTSRLAVIVGPVSVPASVDRPEIVVLIAPNRVAVEEFDRWATPLGDGIARAVALDLAALLGTAQVATAPLANFDPDYRVTIDVQSFESIPGEAAHLEAVWVVRKSAGGETRSGRTVARESTQGEGFEALAAAHSRAVARLSADVAAAIQGEAAKRR